MQLRNFLLTVLAFGLAACDKGEVANQEIKPAHPVEVAIRASHSAMGRTALGDVPSGVQSGTEQPIEWSVGDKIGVWAKADGESAYAVNGAVFTLSTYNDTYDDADFMATIDPMAAGTYTYYAVYPQPSSQSGTTVSYTLPSQQSGAYDPALDVMTATATGNALVSREDDSSANVAWQEPRLSFEHLFHMIRIRIPEGKNLLGQPIKRLDIVFPQDVVGTASFDVTNPSQITWSNLSNKITVDFSDDALLNENNRYVWLHIKAGALQGNLKFRAYSSSGVPSQEIVKAIDKDFKSQRVTPVNLTIPTSDENAYIEISFSCPDNTTYPNFLGENASKMYVKEWPATMLPIALQSTTLEATDGVFKAKFYYLNNEDYQFNLTSGGAKMVASFDSAHATINDIEYTLTLPDFATSQNAYFALPYLYFEDFATVGDTSSHDEYAVSETGNRDGVAINGLPGWTGGRVGSKAGISVRIAPRYESVLAGATYGARIDSTPLVNLTSQSNISVFYNYGMNATYGTFSGGLGGSLKRMYCRIGYVTSAETFGSGAEDGTVVDSYDLYEETASWTNMPYSRSATYSNVPANVTRLMWRGYTETPGGASNCTCWLYIDNIKVSVGNAAKHTNLDYKSYFPNHKN